MTCPNIISWTHKASSQPFRYLESVKSASVQLSKLQFWLSWSNKANSTLVKHLKAVWWQKTKFTLYKDTRENVPDLEKVTKRMLAILHARRDQMHERWLLCSLIFSWSFHRFLQSVSVVTDMSNLLHYVRLCFLSIVWHYQEETKNLLLLLERTKVDGNLCILKMTISIQPPLQSLQTKRFGEMEPHQKS